MKIGDREFIKLTVRNSNGRPYYSIIYLEVDDNGVGHDFEGYSSYSLDVISDYLKKYFMPHAQPKPCGDTISRQAAIDATWEEPTYTDPLNVLTEVRDRLEALPPAEPKKGKWIKSGRWGRVYYCDQCRNYLDFDGVNAGRGSTNYCPNCGCRMDGGE